MANDLKVALLRGINVGGTGKLPMAVLRTLLAGLGAQNVQTYIQSGNVVFSGEITGEKISDAVETAFAFRPKCMVIAARDFTAAVEANPFAVQDPKEMHLYFCSDQPAIDPNDLADHSNGLEKWHLGEKVLYLFSPGGLSKSKLADKLEKRLGVAATARNWNTVQKLMSMIS